MEGSTEHICISEILVSKEYVVLRHWESRQENLIRADEGLTLETSAFQLFHGSNSTFISSCDKTKFSDLHQIK